MATSFQCPTASPYFIPNSKKSSPLKLSPRLIPGKHSRCFPLHLRATASSPTSASAPTTVEPYGSITSATPLKSLPFRVGHGFDLHRLEPGHPLIIGGIDIPHDRGCDAHSDGDVLLHCVVDAILGALGLPDIGQIFPDSDPKWKGAASDVFIREAVRLMHEAGYEIGNVDATLILERPKIKPHKEAIKANLSKLLGADLSAVNLKAKTHEKVARIKDQHCTTQEHAKYEE